MEASSSCNAAAEDSLNSTLDAFIFIAAVRALINIASLKSTPITFPVSPVRWAAINESDPRARYYQLHQTFSGLSLDVLAAVITELEKDL